MTAVSAARHAAPAGSASEGSAVSAPSCRLCGAPLTRTFVDLGMSPPCESYPTAEQVDGPEVFYPLHVRVCERCLLVQLPAYVPAEDIFDDYAYFSSYSASWVEHARRYVDDAVERLGLTPERSFVVEVASNDGYLLQHVTGRGIRCLGIEPSGNVAAAAVERGIPTVVEFLGEETGRRVRDEHGPADLVVANNVFAHVPDILDFARGLRQLVADDGRVSIEIPHLLRLVEGNEYDTIYHEHYSYLSLLTTQRVLAAAGLTVVDVDELPSHGGSLRTWSVPTPDAGAPEPSDAVARVLAAEAAAGLHTVEGHAGFAEQVAAVRDDVLRFLLTARREGKRVVAYGAPGKGNTLLNHCGVRSDLVEFAVDRNPYKHGRFTPGMHLPIRPPEELDAARPDYVVVMPWNLRREISAQLAHVADWGGRLVTFLPRLEVFEPGT
ncbi:class I SAM-dependent methyltransferase [Krasilnikoviella flava]|uniref:Methyltransferase domain-containing protein n=1 Tax=Krasilnikoviella flava TaxID=526729 RepID=A0A1T5IES8_9MICO|nr:class I SAM-dependent methyltransferase [Krasilnikoviella flava]SKC37558.1 Methyltransferase domain-containing protein [Krasilnikoviella flava]